MLTKYEEEQTVPLQGQGLLYLTFTAFIKHLEPQLAYICLIKYRLNKSLCGEVILAGLHYFINYFPKSVIHERISKENREHLSHDKMAYVVTTELKINNLEKSL